MATAEVGILVTAKDAATPVLKGVADASKKTLKSVRELSEKAKKGFDVMGNAITVVNQGLEIGKKAWELMRVAVGDTIAEALRFRRAGDPVLDWFSTMKRDAELLKAAIGDTLIPVVQGLAEGLGIVGDGMRQWIQANRRMIATGILEWTIKLAKSLVKGVGFAVIQVGRAWAGWQQIIGVVQLGIGKFLSFATKGFVGLLEAARSVASAFGRDELVATIDEAQASMMGLAKGFDEFGNEGADGALQASIEFGKLERKVQNFTGVTLAKLDQTYVDTLDKIAKSNTGVTKTVEEQKAATEELQGVVEAISARRIAMIEKRAALEESIMLSLAEKEEERLTELADRYSEVFTGIAEGIGSAVEGVFQDTEQAARLMEEAQQAVSEGAVDAHEKMAAAQEAQADVASNAAKTVLMAVIDAAMGEVAAYAITAGAGAFSSMAGIPIVGPALGAAAAAATTGAVMALGAGLKALVGGMADGGVITTGPAGRDSGIFSLMRGEQVMSVGERAGHAKFMSRLFAGQQMQSGGRPAASDGGRPVIVQTINRTWTPNRVEEMRMTRRQQQRSVRLLEQQGTAF